MVRRHAAVVSLTASLLVLAACSEDGSSSQDSPTDASPSDPESSMSDDPSPTTDAQTNGDLPVGGATEEVRARASVQAAMQDLADRTGTDVGNVTVVGYAAVTWPDGSLGCPQPGRMYSQAVVPGHQLILTVGEGAEVSATGPQVPRGLVSYHAGRKGTFTWCPHPRPPLPPEEGSR
ncbi:MAG: hypothetical protein WA892_12410 [Ornithinimicrobium sp.]